MKTKLHTSFLFLVFIGLQNLQAQTAMFKGGICIPTKSLPFELYTIGFEVKPHKNISYGISYKTLSKYGNQTLKQSLLTFQSRYYFNNYLDNDDWANARYCGIVLQKLDKKYNLESPLEFFKHRTIVEMEKVGIGIILGRNIRVYKRCGLDLNCGFVGQIGKESKSIIYGGSTADKYFYSSRDINLRAFIGLNFYIALGDMNTPKSVTQ